MLKARVGPKLALEIPSPESSQGPFVPLPSLDGDLLRVVPAVAPKPRIQRRRSELAGYRPPMLPASQVGPSVSASPRSTRYSSSSAAADVSPGSPTLPQEPSTSLTTHVLDAIRGGPAVGLQVRLLRGSDQVASGRTGPDGRLHDLASNLEPGTYRLVFETGEYFGSASHLFTTVSLDLALNERGPYHVPLLLGAFSITSYRGT